MSSSSAQDPAGVRRHQSDNHVEGGGLAGAVGSKQPNHFSALYRQRNAVDHTAAL